MEEVGLQYEYRFEFAKHTSTTTTTRTTSAATPIHLSANMRTQFGTLGRQARKQARVYGGERECGGGLMVRLITTNSELGCGAAAQTEQEIRKVLTGSEIVVLQMNLYVKDCGTIIFF